MCSPPRFASNAKLGKSFNDVIGQLRVCGVRRFQATNMI